MTSLLYYSPKHCVFNIFHNKKIVFSLTLTPLATTCPLHPFTAKVLQRTDYARLHHHHHLPRPSGLAPPCHRQGSCLAQLSTWPGPARTSLFPPYLEARQQLTLLSLSRSLTPSFTPIWSPPPPGCSCSVFAAAAPQASALSPQSSLLLSLSLPRSSQPGLWFNNQPYPLACKYIPSLASAAHHLDV